MYNTKSRLLVIKHFNTVNTNTYIFHFCICLENIHKHKQSSLNASYGVKWKCFLQMVPYDLPLHAGIMPRLVITIIGEPLPGADRYHPYNKDKTYYYSKLCLYHFTTSSFFAGSMLTSSKA